MTKVFQPGETIYWLTGRDGSFTSGKVLKFTGQNYIIDATHRAPRVPQENAFSKEEVKDKVRAQIIERVANLELQWKASLEQLETGRTSWVTAVDCDKRAAELLTSDYLK